MIDTKQQIIDILDFWKYKILHNGCTPEDFNTIGELAKNGNLDIGATIKELADFYGKSENAVKLQINHKMLEKPKRRVQYSFTKFNELVSDKWLRDK